jgi:DNA polymerase I
MVALPAKPRVSRQTSRRPQADRPESPTPIRVGRTETVGTGEPVLDGNDARPVEIPAIRVGRPVSYSIDPALALHALGKSDGLSIDLETQGLHPHAVSKQFPDPKVGAIICRIGEQNFIFREFPSWWKDLLADSGTKKIMHNGKFDLMWMIDAFEGDLLYARNIQDTMIKSQLAGFYRTKEGAAKAGYPGKWEPNDLASALNNYLGVEIKKEIDHEVTDWAGSWSTEMEEYMLEDIEYLTHLDDKLDQELISQGQEMASWIENRTVFAYAWMTYNGIKPDVEEWAASVERWKNERTHLLWHLVKYFPDIYNYNSPAQAKVGISNFLGYPLPNTKKATLQQLASSYPEIRAFLQERQLETYIKNWGDQKGGKRPSGFMDFYLCKLCRRFHPNWIQIGTETARTACRSPNLQQIPHAPEFRKMFVAEDGFLLASLDYSAIEVLVAAVQAEDRNLIRACASGDPHAWLASQIVGRPIDKRIPEDARLRQLAKIADFGLLFAGGKEGLIVQARDLFDTILTEQQAGSLMGTFFSNYPRLRITRNAAYQAMKSSDRCLELTNAVGFRRYLEGFNRKPTTWLNSWIQSTAGHGLKSSFPYLMELGLLPYLCMQVHDELVFEFFEETAYDDAALAKSAMIRGMQDVIGSYPVNVDDSAIGRVWL